MNELNRCRLLFIFAVTFPLLAVAGSTGPKEPFVNPFLAGSTYSVTHARANFTPTPGPVGPGRRLRGDEIQWKGIGPLNATAPMYSDPYPNGKRVIWIGGYDRVAKLDADTLEVLANYATGVNPYFGPDEIERHVSTIDKLDDKSFVDYNLKLWPRLFWYASSFYHLLSRDNEFFLPSRLANGATMLQVFGDADSSDPSSRIVLRREWKIPAELSKAPVFGMNMTADGWVVVATADGTLIAMSRDLETRYSLKLPNKKAADSDRDLFSAFMRNGIAVDDHGGIYVVTRDNMHRVQWTGSKLSLDEADGAWSVPYPNETGIGSGTTPGLMGWGNEEDHLVIIADGTRGNNAMAFWRDRIPDDWKGLPGYDRRVAGVAPIHFGVSKAEQAQVENTPVIYGYGVFFNNTFPERRFMEQESATKQWLADSYAMHIPGYEAKGGAMLRWDSRARVLRTAWQTQTNFVSTVCTASGATGILYCWGARNREWTLEGTDWNTGKSAFHYTLGKSHRFNPMGNPVIIAPNGAVDCGCNGGFGFVRVRPRVKP